MNFQFNLMSTNSKSSRVVPPGVAHGFQAIEDSLTLYNSSEVHQPKYDSGVNIIGLEIPWPLKIEVISSRDMTLPDIKYWKERP